jgi:hypothetical protein
MKFIIRIPKDSGAIDDLGQQYRRVYAIVFAQRLAISICWGNEVGLITPDAPSDRLWEDNAVYKDRDVNNAEIGIDGQANIGTDGAEAGKGPKTSARSRMGIIFTHRDVTDSETGRKQWLLFLEPTGMAIILFILLFWLV